METDSNRPESQEWKRTLVFFLSSQTLSLVGTSLVQYAIMWHITLTAKSGLVQTIAVLATFLPNFLLSPFAGVWADRYDRKRLMMIADGGIALVTLVVAFAFQAGMRDLWLFFVASALRAMGSAVQVPAVGAFLPQFVPQEHLARINGINQSIQAATMLGSPMAAAFLLGFFPLETIFFIDVVTAALAIAVLAAGVKVPAHQRAASPTGTSYFHDLREGVRYVRSHGYVMRFFAYCAVFMFMAAPAAFLTPLQVARSFGTEVWRLSAIEVAFFLGMTIGGMAIASWGGFKNRVWTMVLATALFGMTTFGMGVLPWFWAFLGVMGVCGLAMPLFNTPSTVLLQEQVEPEFLGRVFGVMGMLGSSMMPMGMLLFGPLADLVRIEVLLMISGAVMAVQALAMGMDRSLLSHGVAKHATQVAQASEAPEQS